jgi:hypothetical protein
MRRPDVSRKQIKRVELDELASGRLPERIIAAINEMKLSVGEMMQLETSKSPIRFSLTDGKLSIDIRIRIPIKKTIAIGGVGGLLLAVGKLVIWYLIQRYGGLSVP